MPEKEKILAAARKESLRGKEYEVHVQDYGATLSAPITIVVGFILFITEYYCNHHFNINMAIVAILGCGIEFAYQGKKLSKFPYLVSGIFMLLVAILLFAVSMYGMVVA